MYEDLVERLREYFDRSIWGLPSDILQAADAIETLESKLNRLKREREVLLTDITGCCTYCLHDRPYESVLPSICKDCIKENGHRPNWQWRGVQEER